MALPSIQLGPYQLHERIGEGGNGQVYRATGPAGAVAIKLMGNPSDFDDAQLARFRREIATLGELSHPNLIAMLDHGVDAELGPYLVLPLLSGATLRDLCRARALCPEAALLLILPVAEATAALHARSYVHRDLKPENTIATPDGAITVIDLGLAWGEGMSRHTESGAAVGSIGYMSPEQLDSRGVGTPADVWALGVMIYEAITGKRPFARARPTEEVAATLLGSYARLTAADRRTGDELAELVASCLAQDPAKRPAVADLASRLRALIDWTSEDQLVAERAAAIADPVGYQARVAAFRVRRLERLAREAIEAGKPFVALALCDRGLAYVADHPALLELIATAESATARAPAPPRTTEDDLALAKVVTATGATTGGTPVAVAAPTTETRKASRNVLIAIAATVLAVAIVFLIARQQQQDPWAARSSEPVTTTTKSALNEGDRALVHDFIGMFSKALDSSKSSPGKPPTGAAPTTATGWLELAKTQDPTEAVTSIRHALQLNPEWPEAQDALCVMLAALKDAGAIDICTTSIRRDALEVSLRQARGVALVNADRPVEALADLDIVVAADPSPKWRRLRATARAAAGDEAGAQTDLENACQMGDAVACQAKR